MPKLFAKLKSLKGHLKWWNRDVFGNIFDKITEAESSVRLAKAACEADPSEHSWTLLSKCNEDLARITSMEADFWKQKAACNWLEDGERNTKLFHIMVKKKRVTNKIFHIWEDGTCLTSPDLIQQSGAAYFQRLLTRDPFVLDIPDFSGFSLVISEAEKICIAATPTLEEVLSIVFSIPRDSVAGPDGYSSVFFQHYWDFVQQDGMDAVLDFFQGSPLPQGFTATTITLVPKLRVLMLGRISVPSACAVRLLRAGCEDGAGFHFLLQVLGQCQWYSRWFFWFYDGFGTRGSFEPLLFIIAAEYLSCGLDRLFLQNADLRYRSGCEMMISHLAYADDVIIFANGGSRGMQRLKDFLAHYENCSGQLVNVAKTAMIFPPHCTARRRSHLLRITGFAEG
ncbi:uncharacterized protein [Henckelia pumila]|uniref:uncharacterized protein n=1 Tax=Henckelia pumila TaxID=405737 RepID=UPI003C6EA1FE